MLGQQRQVLAPFAQRRGADLQDVEPVVEVLAERPGIDRRLQVDMGRRQHPHVHLDRPATADPLDLLFLEKAQQVGLQLQRQVADLVEE